MVHVHLNILFLNSRPTCIALGTTNGYTAGHPVHGTVATLISFVTLLIAPMGMFSELQDTLNFIWRIPRNEHKLVGKANRPWTNVSPC